MSPRHHRATTAPPPHHHRATTAPPPHRHRTATARPKKTPPSKGRTRERTSPERGDWRRVHMKMQDCRHCTTMTEHGEREASVCLPCAVHCTTTTECGCGDRGYLDAGRTLDHASRTRREGASPLLLPRGCIPSSPAFLHRGENSHFLLIPHILQKGSFDSLNPERHLTFRLSSPIGRFSFPVFSVVLKGFPFFARSIIEPMFCVLQSRPAS